MKKLRSGGRRSISLITELTWSRFFFRRIYALSEAVKVIYHGFEVKFQPFHFLERLAFSVIWELNDNAKILSVKFHKSVIKSKSAFTYEEAQIRIDDKSKTDSLTESLRGLNYLAKKLKAQRLEDGALTLASVEVRFHLDSETADPIDLYTKELKETNSMVEEFMLLANCSVSGSFSHL